MSGGATFIAAPHDLAWRIAHGPSSRGAALVDGFMLDRNIETVVWVARATPSRFLLSAMGTDSFRMEKYTLLAGGMFGRFKYYAGRRVANRCLLLHCLPYRPFRLSAKLFEEAGRRLGGIDRLVVLTPKEAELIGSVGASRIVFDADVDWRLAPPMRHRLPILERGYQAAQKADVLIAVNRATAAMFPGRTDVKIVPNAGQGRIFFPPLVKSRNAVIVVGRLHEERLDLELLLGLLRAYPKVRFDFFGRIDWPAALNKLSQTANFRSMGEIHPTALRAAMAGYSAAVIPQPVNAYTQSQDMIKVYELMGAGLPIVSPALPPCDAVPEMVYLFTGLDGAERGLEAALAERNAEQREARMSWADCNTWDHRGRDFKRWVFG